MTISQVLARAASSSPTRQLSIVRGGGISESVTYDALHAEAGEIASCLKQRGIVQGERIGLAFPNSIGFARALFGVLAAGAVAVPLPPPFRFAALEIHLKRIAMALEQSAVRLIIADEKMASLLSPAFATLAESISVVCVDDMQSNERTYVDVDDGSPALVQYTSGTSGTPKGVILTHANLLSNIEAIKHGLDLSADDDIGCSWLPLFHDMGLIGHMLLPVAYGADNYLMRSEDFLRDPLSWLRAISDFRATVSTAPSSAYAHCIRHIKDEDVRSLDLSRWRLALNGAEAVDGRIMRQFASKFQPAGFRLSSFLPVYGLAEAALAVTVPSIGRNPVSVRVNREDLTRGRVTKSSVTDETARELVSVGVAVSDCEYRLLAHDGIRTCEPNEVGEIFVRGSSVSVGYENSIANSGASRRADEWISTGDLGVEIDNELYIVGRKKEVLVFFGANYYASDIESVVGALPGIPSRGVLATSVPTDHSEGELLLFIETDEISEKAKENIAAAVRLAVSSSVGLSPRYIEFVPKGRIERTSSGKLRRHGIESLVDECLQRTGFQIVD